MLIEVKFGDTYADLDPSLVDYVVRESVTDRFRTGVNGGASSITVAVDDANVTRRWDNSSPAQRADSWLIDGWVDLLAPARDSAAFSSRPGFEADTAQWAPPPPRCDPEWWPLL
jgi:hypothetical protein